LTKLLNFQNDQAVVEYKSKLQNILQGKNREVTTTNSGFESLLMSI